MNAIATSTSRLDSSPHPSLARGGTGAAQQPRVRCPKESGEFPRLRNAGDLAPRDLPRVPRGAHTDQLVDLAEAEVGDLALEDQEARGDFRGMSGMLVEDGCRNHDSYPWPVGTSVVKRDVSQRSKVCEIQGVSSVRQEQLVQRREIAARVRAWVEEQTATTPALTVRQLSIACGWDGSHLGTVLRRLEAGKDVRTETLRTIATAIGRPVAWLETGTMPEGILLASDERWAEAAAGATALYKLSPEAVAAIGLMRVPESPRRLDAHVVAQLARAWADALNA